MWKTVIKNNVILGTPRMDFICDKDILEGIDATAEDIVLLEEKPVYVNGQWYLAGQAPTEVPDAEAIRRARENHYSLYADNLTARKVRKTSLGEWNEAEEAAYLAEMQRVKRYVDEHFPYPSPSGEDIDETAFGEDSPKA